MKYEGFHKVNRWGVYERQWFTGLVYAEIISAGDASSMSLCLCVLAAAAWPNDNNNLPFVMGVDDIHPDEFNLILTMKTKCEHSPQMSNLWFTSTIQFLTTFFPGLDQT